MSHSWTEKALAELKQLHEQGLSGGRIAAILGVTRGSVMGKMHRMKFPKKEKTPPHTPHKYKRPPAGANLELNPKCVPLPVSSRNPDVMVLCTFAELKDESCRYPIGQPQDANFRFCGNQRADDKAPYCEHHMATTHTTAAQHRADRQQTKGFTYYVPPQI
jgi:GcrA cell cycle regulator